MLRRPVVTGKKCNTISAIDRQNRTLSIGVTIANNFSRALVMLLACDNERPTRTGDEHAIGSPEVAQSDRDRKSLANSIE